MVGRNFIQSQKYSGLARLDKYQYEIAYCRRICKPAPCSAGAGRVGKEPGKNTRGNISMGFNREQR
jgi:hypothetical protein